MHKDFWKYLREKWPIVALAPMDGYGDSPYRQIVKRVAPETVVFSEFYSADGLVHSKELQRKALKHDPSEYPLIIQIFGKDPAMFREAAKIIEWYGITGIDINMWCPAKKVVKSGHGSSLMINRDTAYKIVEEMANAVKIPISVKTRLGWENSELLVNFVKWLENAGANLISVHGRTYKQAFTGQANFTGIYELKQHVDIPVVCNGDVMSYEDGVRKLTHPENVSFLSSRRDVRDPFQNHVWVWNDQNLLNENERDSSFHSEWQKKNDLDWFMIGRASFGNPWCFLPWDYKPTLREILDIMSEHGKLLWQWKERKGMMEARKHLVQYLHGFPGVKEYRTRLVHVESIDDIEWVISTIRHEHASLLWKKMSAYNPESSLSVWECGSD
jgi:tRNA-dihydrouridine synthase B